MHSNALQSNPMRRTQDSIHSNQSGCPSRALFGLNPLVRRFVHSFILIHPRRTHLPRPLYSIPFHSVLFCFVLFCSFLFYLVLFLPDSVIVVWSSLPSVMESLKPMLPSTRGSITLLYPSLPTALPTVSNGQDSRLARIDGFDVRFYAAKRTDSDRSVGCSCKLLLRTTYVFYYFSINKTTGGAARVLLPLLSTERTVSVRVVCVVSLCVVCLYVLCVLCVCMYGLCVLCVL